VRRSSQRDNNCIFYKNAKTPKVLILSGFSCLTGSKEATTKSQKQTDTSMTGTDYKNINIITVNMDLLEANQLGTSTLIVMKNLLYMHRNEQ